MPIFSQIGRRPALCRRASWGRRWSLTVLFAALSVSLAASLTFGAEPTIAQPNVVAPGVYNFGHDSEENEQAYYGYLDLTANRGAVYFTTKADLTLGDLVAGASRSAAPPSGMAQIVRDGGAGIHIPWSPGSTERLLPGDLVIFHGNRRQGAVGATRQGGGVAVAFVGLLGRRPIVVSLVASNATVPRVVDMLLQPLEVCQSVRVIRTNQNVGPLAPGETPKRLADGDVLVFDRSRMDAAALAHTQDTYQTEFPPAIELRASNATDSGPEQNQTAEPSASLTGAAQVIAGPLLVEAPAPTPEVTSTVSAEQESSTDEVTADVTQAEPWDLTDLSPASAETDESARTEPQFPALASLVEPSDLGMDDPLEAASAAHFEAALQLAPAEPPSEVVAAPKPLEAAPAAATPIDQRSFPKFNAVTISASVLVLALVCFGVSVLWTQIDRAAQDLQQPINARTGEQKDAPAHRLILDRLIVNKVPVIEEPAQLPDRMDYHGEELGRRRMMLDQPHEELIGPHFPVEAGVTDISRSKERVHSVTSGFAKEIGADGGSPDTDIVAEAEIHTPQETTTDGKTIRNDAATPAADKRETVQRQPHGKLLDRVLLAMEREKRR